MTKVELQERIEKVEIKIGKIEKRIAKWQNKINNKKEFDKEHAWLLFDASESRKQEIFENYNKDCLYEIRSAERDLEDAKTTLAKYQSQLNEKVAFEQSAKIEVIWNFLQNWKVEANSFYHSEVARLNELKKWHREQFDKYANKPEYRKEYNETYREYEDRLKDFSELTRSIRQYDGSVDEERLEKLLNLEVEAKYKDFIRRIGEVVGKIKDASLLRVAGNGSINGIVKGENGNCNVETILAGGWNIQCLHYRVLVHKIRG